MSPVTVMIWEESLLAETNPCDRRSNPMPFIDSRGHRRPLDPRRGVDEPRTVEVVRPMQRHRSAPGLDGNRAQSGRAWTARNASPSRSAVGKHVCALVSDHRRGWRRRWREPAGDRAVTRPR
jgi:hypothetical protein